MKEILFLACALLATPACDPPVKVNGDFDNGGGGSGGSGSGGSGSGSGSAGGDSVRGVLFVDIVDSDYNGSWSIEGVTSAPCSGCTLRFDGEFTVMSSSGFGEDFSTAVYWTDDGYVYGFSDDYWGRGAPTGNGYAYWAGYSTNGNYYYSGNIVY